MSSVKTHPVSPTELLLYAEGELPRKASSQIHSHLLGCTGCQAELQDLRDGIQALVQLHNDSALLSPPPPRAWEPLDARIEMWESRWSAGLLLKNLRAIARPRYSLAALAVLALAAVCLILRPWNEPVSANELLARASVAQNQSLSHAQGRVIHQRLQICRKSKEHGRQSVTTANYESWQDSDNRFHESSSSVEISSELRGVYQANHLDWKSPLSAAAYESWQNLLSQEQASVARNGSAAFTLTTVVGGQPEGDAIGKAQLVVNAADWLPMTVHLWLHDREYEISEVNSELLLPSQINPPLFDTPAAQSPRTSRVTPMKRISPPALTSQTLALTPETMPIKPNKPSTEIPASEPANSEAAAPMTRDNVPDAPSPARIPTFSRPTVSAPLLTFTLTTSGGRAPAKSHKSSDVTLTDQPDSADRTVRELQPQATTAPILVPNIIKPRPFKAFESSTVVITSPQPRPAEPCLFKTLKSKLGIVKKKKTEPAASSKPGG